MIRFIATAGALGIDANATVWFCYERRLVLAAIGASIFLGLFRTLDRS